MVILTALLFLVICFSCCADGWFLCTPAAAQVVGCHMVSCSAGGLHEVISQRCQSIWRASAFHHGQENQCQCVEYDYTPLQGTPINEYDYMCILRSTFMFTFAACKENAYKEVCRNSISCIQYAIFVYKESGCLIDSMPFRDPNSMISPGGSRGR